MQIELILLLFTALVMIIYLIYDLDKIKIDNEAQQVVDNLNDDLEVAIKNAIEYGVQQNIVNVVNGVMDEYVVEGLLDSDTTSTRPAKYFKGVAANNNPIYNAAGSIRINVLT